MATFRNLDEVSFIRALETDAKLHIVTPSHAYIHLLGKGIASVTKVSTGTNGWGFGAGEYHCQLTNQPVAVWKELLTN